MMTSAPLAFHPLAEIFPLLEGKDFADLVEDIRTHGLHEPIVMHEDMVLDGRNRFRACQAAGVEPAFVPFPGDDPLAFVISANLHRRHLNESQRAMVAAKLAEIFKERDNGIKTIAAIERWDRERELAEISNDPFLSWNAKEEMRASLRARWAKKARQKFLRNLREVYVAADGRRMKVGVSSLPTRRVNNLKVGEPAIELIDSWPGAFADEKKLHELLASYRIGGEWFQYCEAALTIVRDYMQNRQLADVQHISALNLASKDSQCRQEERRARPRGARPRRPRAATSGRAWRGFGVGRSRRCLAFSG